MHFEIGFHSPPSQLGGMSNSSLRKEVMIGIVERVLPGGSKKFYFQFLSCKYIFHLS